MDKNREQFERWRSKNKAPIDSILESGIQEHVENLLWLAWKHSRRHVKIQLPYYCEGYEHDSELISEIESHGIRVVK